MRKLHASLIFIFSFLCIPIFAQYFPEDEIHMLFLNEEYERIIEQYTSQDDLHSAKALFQIGYSYFMMEDDENALNYLDRSLEKDPEDGFAHHMKGVVFSFNKKYEEAIPHLEKAILFAPQQTAFYTKLGEAYLATDRREKALEIYQKVIEKNNDDERAYYTINLIHQTWGDMGKSLEILYQIKEKITPSSSIYTDLLFNIGQMEIINNNYPKAETAFSEIITIDPADFHSYTKLIQIYYNDKEYEKAEPLKAKLYEAHEKNTLTENLKDRFCFDQFKWKDKLIRAFERYENEEELNAYDKHQFFVIGQNGEVEWSIQTSYSPYTTAAGEPKYMLCATKPNGHFNSGIRFDDNLDYDTLKKEVINILENLQ